jgi:prevent-host-death family protein
MADGFGDTGEPDHIYKVAEAKAQLSELIARAEDGERVVIARGNEPAVMLVPIRPARRPLGILRHLIPGLDPDKIAKQLAEPYTEEELDAFEGDLDAELKEAGWPAS